MKDIHMHYFMDIDQVMLPSEIANRLNPYALVGNGNTGFLLTFEL
jgi:hypothetical protein